MLSSHSSDAMLMDELQHVHSGTLLFKQQQQERLSYLNHISTGMMIDRLPQLHGYALQLKQQAMLLIDFNQLLLKPQMLSSDAMLIDELQHMHHDALQLKQRQQELLSYLNHISTGVMVDELP